MCISPRTSTVRVFVKSLPWLKEIVFEDTPPVNVILTFFSNCVAVTAFLAIRLPSILTGSAEFLYRSFNNLGLTQKPQS